MDRRQVEQFMTTSEALFHRFFDDAATFPPGLAPLHQAVAHAIGRRTLATADTVGPSVLKLDDVSEARRLAHELGVTYAQPLPIAIVVPPRCVDDALAAAATAGPYLSLVSFELKVSEADTETWRDEIHYAAANAAVPVYVELNPGHLDQGGLQLLAETGLRLKYRTGGLVPEAFPTSAQLLQVIITAVHSGVPFKLTAGLHRAVRYTDATTGFTHHGFLNIAQAVDAVRNGAIENTVADILSTTDEHAIAAWAQRSDGTWRESFESFGTCSVSEPLETLAELALVPAHWAPARQAQSPQEVLP